MVKRVILFILLLFGGLSISQCSLINGGNETISGPHYEFLIFNENEVQTKPLKIGDNYEEHWWRDQLLITKTDNNNLAIYPGSGSVLIASPDLTIISSYSPPYDEYQLGPWFKVNKQKDTIRWDDAVSDSVTFSITVDRFNTEDPYNPSLQKVHELHSVHLSQERFLEKIISSYRMKFTGYELYGYDVMNKMVKDSLGTKLFINPYYHILNTYHLSSPDAEIISAEKIDHVPTLDISYINFVGTLNNRFSFVLDYQNLRVFDSQSGSWHSVSTDVRAYSNLGNTSTSFTDTSFAFFTQNKLMSYNPYTQKLSKLHTLEESDDEAIVQYEEESRKLFFTYHYREVKDHIFTDNHIVKVFSIDNEGQKTEIFSKIYSNSESVVSNFIKVDGRYYTIVKKHL